jgi:Uma2 family endonuclease
MRTVVVGTRPPELVALIAKRRALGLDTFDELWNGEYHMNPALHPRHGRLDRQLARLLDPIAEQQGLLPLSAFNLGGPEDYRVPDFGYLQSYQPESAFVACAVLVAEIVSPGDESFEKLPFYAEHGVAEVLIVDPEAKTVRVFRGLQEVPDSEVLGISTAWLETTLDWPE